MNAITTAIALTVFIGGAPQDPALESRAVIRVQQTPASQYDPALPGRPFGSWFNQIVGPQSGVTWHLTECIERGASVATDARGVPACVEANAILPDDRKVVVQILAGSFRQGLSSVTRFHFAVLEDDDQFRDARRLGELPQLLRTAFPKTGPQPIVLPRLRSAGIRRLYLSGSPFLIAPPNITFLQETEDVPPPPLRSAALRVSKGVYLGATVTRVMPVYPAFARQVKASGEVQVEIIIDESGRVIEAKSKSGHPMLRSAAEDAARKWVFKPTLLGGKPVKQQGLLTFVFTLPE